MKLAELEGAYDGFYVPASVIRVARRDIVNELFLTVTAIEVSLKLNAAGRFSFTIASAFDWETHQFLGKARNEVVDLLDLFAFGAPVEVKIGYGDFKKLPTLIEGVVTELGTSFAESGTPALTISGYDPLFELGIGVDSRAWDDAKPSKAVADVAAIRGLKVRITAQDGSEKRIDQNKESDRDFIDRMAKLAKCIFYIRDGELRFGPRRNDAAAAIELVWGEGLSSFSPSANLAKQISAVEVHSWSAAKGKSIVGKAVRGDEKGIDGSAKSGSQWTGKAFGKAPILSVSAPVFTQEEADARAKAILESRAQDFVTGEGECVGLPNLLPDTNIAISGVGKAFNKTYYVGEVTHSLDGKGFRTRFHVEEPSI
jgi:phage protein D